MSRATRLGLCGLLLTLACGSAEHTQSNASGGNGAGGTATGGSSSAGGTTTGAGGASSTGGRVAGSAGAAGAIPIDALAKPWVAAVCEYFERCLAYDAFADFSGGCVGYEQPRVENTSIPLLKAEIANGKVRYNADEIAACLESYSSAACGANEAVGPNCLAAIDGTVALGGACISELECAGNVRCDISAGCPGVCKSYLSQGEACSLSRDCGPGLGCAISTGVCVALAREGEPCRGPTQGECNSGLLCIGAASDIAGTCQALRQVQVGEPCVIGSATVCTKDAACVIVGKAANGDWEERCAAPSTSLGQCSVGAQDSCPLGEYCPLTAADRVNGVYTASCRPLATEGEACVANPAACGTTGVCGADSHCLEFRKVGEACQNDSDCYTQDCVGNVCQLDLGCR